MIACVVFSKLVAENLSLLQITVVLQTPVSNDYTGVIFHQTETDVNHSCGFQLNKIIKKMKDSIKIKYFGLNDNIIFIGSNHLKIFNNLLIECYKIN